jgi:hypothetical protein
MIIISFVAKIDISRFDGLRQKPSSDNLKVTKSTTACFVVREEFIGKYADLRDKVLNECGQRFSAFATEVGTGNVEFGVQVSGYKEIESGSGFFLTPIFLKTISEYSPWMDVDFHETSYVQK